MNAAFPACFSLGKLFPGPRLRYRRSHVSQMHLNRFRCLLKAGIAMVFVAGTQQGPEDQAMEGKFCVTYINDRLLCLSRSRLQECSRD